jgi:hypothetical protein
MHWSCPGAQMRANAGTSQQAHTVGEHSKVETAQNVPVHFSKLPQGQPQIPAKSVVYGQAKLRAKQRTEQPSQPRGHPRATSPTCVSRVTWGPSQVVLIPDWSKRSHKGSYKGSYKGSHKESTKDVCGNLESSHNFNIISELNVILAIQ